MEWEALRAKYVDVDREAFLAEASPTWIECRVGLSGNTTFVTKRIQAGSNPRRHLVMPLAKRPGSNAFGNMITIGRAGNNDLVLDHDSISKFHAFFKREGDEWTVRDGQSLNGTLVDGVEAAAPTPIAQGAAVKLGEVELTLLSAEELFERIQAGS